MSSDSDVETGYYFGLRPMINYLAEKAGLESEEFHRPGHYLFYYPLYREKVIRYLTGGFFFNTVKFRLLRGT